MSQLVIKRVAVLGAGVMGAQIAAHCVNARVPALLFDLPSSAGPKNDIVATAIDRLKKLNPSPLVNPDDTVHEFLDRFQGTPVTTIPTPATASAAESAFEEQQRVAGAVLKVVLITVPLIVLILYFSMRVRTPGSETSSPASPPPAAANTPSEHAPAPSAAAPAPADTSSCLREGCHDRKLARPNWL